MICLRKTFYIILFFVISLPAHAQLIVDMCFCDDSNMPNSLLTNEVGVDAIDINDSVQSDGGNGIYVPYLNSGLNVELERDIFSFSHSISLEFEFAIREEYGFLFSMGAFEILMYKGALEATYLVGDGLDTIRSGFHGSMNANEVIKASFSYVKETGKARIFIDGQKVWQTPDNQTTAGEDIFWPEENALLGVDLDGNAATQPVLYDFKAYGYGCREVPKPVAADQVKCGSGSLTLKATATNGGDLVWYDSLTNFRPLRIGATNEYNTPEIDTTTTFFVAQKQGECTSDRVAVNAVISPEPREQVNLSPSDTAVCSGQSFIIWSDQAQSQVTYTLLNSQGDAVSSAMAVEGQLSLTTGPVDQDEFFQVSARVDSSGCNVILQDTLAVKALSLPDQPAITSDPDNLIQCSGDTLMLKVPSAHNYLWIKDNDTLPDTNRQLLLDQPDQSGIYAVQVKQTAEGCYSPLSDGVAVEIKPLPPVPVTSDASRCGPGQVDLKASGPDSVSLVWFDGSGGAGIAEGRDFASPSLSASYSYFVASSYQNCLSEKVEVEAHIQPLPSDQVQVIPEDTTICKSAVVQFRLKQSQPNVTYHLLGPDSQILDTAVVEDPILNTGSIVQDTRFSISAKTDTSGCSVTLSDQVMVNVKPAPEPPALSLVQGKEQSCRYDTVILAASEGIGYQWFRNDTLMQHGGQELRLSQKSGSYKVRIKQNGNPCFSDSSAALNINFQDIPPVPQVQDTGRCGPGAVQLQVSSPTASNYRWFNSTGADLIADSISATMTTPILEQDAVFYVAAEEGECSSPKAAIEVKIYALPQADAGPDDVVRKGEQITLQGSGGISYRWHPAVSVQFPQQATTPASPAKPTTYTLFVKDERGCSGQDEVHINVMEQVVFFPNSFSPNGDGLNDTWELVNIDRYPQCEIYIFNRWGNLVYHSNGYQQPWDGRVNNQAPVRATYIYKVVLDHKTQPFSGSVNVIK